MKSIEFKEVNLRIAEHQEEYETLPALVNTEKGTVTSCWKLSEEELKIINETGVFWVQQLSFNQPLQPIYITTNKKEVIDN